MTPPYVLKLIAGDWSGDGHNITEDVWIKSNLNEEQLLAAAKVGMEKLGLDYEEPNWYKKAVILSACRRYDEHQIPDSERAKLGLEPNDPEGWDSTDAEEWFDIYLKIVEAGNPSFKYEYFYNDGWIPVGGYGLFSQ